MRKPPESMRTRQLGASTAAKALILIVATTALVGAVWGLVHYVGAYMTAQRAQAYAAGRTAALKEVGDRDNADLRAAREEVERLRKRVQELETDAEDELAVASAQFEKEKQNAEAKIADLDRRVRAGELKLRDPGRGAEDPGRAGNPDRGATPPAPAGGAEDGRTGAGELSGQATTFLLSEADRADETVRRLNLCKATVRTYLKACNASLEDAVHAPLDHPAGGLR